MYMTTCVVLKQFFKINTNLKNYFINLYNYYFVECKVWRNPLGLFRGAEYSRYYNATKREPLTFYDMNLSAQDHQAFFICDADNGKPDYESIKQL